MSSYLGRHADLYDLFYAEKPYNHEAEFVAQQLVDSGIKPPARLLEIACGTGRHARRLESLGFEVVAVDYSDDMLRAARQRSEASGSKVDFRWADMRSLDLLDGPFDAAVCLFDSIGYVQTNEAIHASLSAIHRHVKPGGWFVFEFWHAAAMLRDYDPVRIRRWPTQNGEVLRISETELDCARQLSHVTYTIYELDTNGHYETTKETQTNRYFLIQEMASMLTHSGWQAHRWFAGFTPCEDVNEGTWHVVALARREPSRPANS